jgi:t-SNARE complex subunit (syntaxin)
MNANDLKTVGANKTKMLKQVERMLNIVDQYYGQNLQRELEQLRDALESANEDDIGEAISDTIDGCATATSQLRDLNWALDDFEQAQHDYEQVFRNDIDAFESK